jgi:hypothetical protein
VIRPFTAVKLMRPQRGLRTIAREEVMANRQKGRTWKLERASVSRQAKPRPRSNKYSASDRGQKPAAGARERVWVGGYTRADGTKVSGYYRDTP